MEIKNIKNIVIAGAGVMGSSMAQTFAQSGYKVTLYDLKDEYLDRSRNLININQSASVDKKIFTKQDSENIMGNISFTCSKDCFRSADFVVEAIVENMDIKHSFWSEVSETAPEDAILTTNTSGLSITKIAEAVKNPERFCGMHWINPPHIIPLIEVINGDKTAAETSKLVYDISKLIGKQPIMINKDAPGFVLNRFQFAVLREAMHIIEEGIASKEDIDNVFKYGLGIRYACLGPLEIADLGGLDTFYNISSYLTKDLSNTKEVSSILSDLVNDGNYGVKSGKGFYDYSNGRDKEVIRKRDEDFYKVSECLFGEK
ncbi:3-hydroxyacyl-CoA dehydrogenase family protein [Proteocatella sphenisci]|uniref:3-hydroxyacyl-CoA dehydrogenase family protein n=1 Tax=Proteocatella sphenisci TaxID=181070 RepID=UPI00048CFF5C|nr:3-hydroxyacyl-CoA dehydrogenase family protein [Proteocatella sphenisci]